MAAPVGGHSGRETKPGEPVVRASLVVAAAAVADFVGDFVVVAAVVAY